jgi:hypothetical protein
MNVGLDLPAIIFRSATYDLMFPIRGNQTVCQLNGLSRLKQRQYAVGNVCFCHFVLNMTYNDVKRTVSENRAAFLREKWRFKGT